MEILVAGKEYTVRKGPDKSAVLAQLGDIGRFPAKDRPTVTLQIEDGKLRFPIEVLINGVGAESGSGYQWLINGYRPGSSMKYHGYLDTHKRNGWVMFR